MTIVTESAAPSDGVADLLDLAALAAAASGVRFEASDLQAMFGLRLHLAAAAAPFPLAESAGDDERERQEYHFKHIQNPNLTSHDHDRLKEEAERKRAEGASPGAHVWAIRAHLHHTIAEGKRVEEKYFKPGSLEYKDEYKTPQNSGPAAQRFDAAAAAIMARIKKSHN